MKQRIKVGNKWAGEGEPVFIIAEAGSNHDRKLEQAKQLIDIAAQSGADAVKFQLFRAESFYRPDDPVFSLMKQNELPWEWIGELAAYADYRGLVFLASPFDAEAVDLLDAAGSPAFKIASSETVNLPLVRHAAAKRRPLLVATGMCSLADLYEALEAAKSAGNDELIFLHTSSLYPTEPADVDLRAMDTIRGAFGVPAGLSDHTLGIAVPAAAAARGACVIEKHFTVSRSLPGPDHSYALEPDQLAQMVRAIRDVEQALGSSAVQMHPKVKAAARRNSLAAKQDIQPGAVITADMVVMKRPATGIEPRLAAAVIGRKAKKAIKKDCPLTWDMIG